MLSRVRDAVGSVIVAGDLNATPHSRFYKQLLKSGELISAADGQGFSTTWNAKNPLIRFAIDHLLYKGELAVSEYRLGPAVGSDHYPLITTLSFPQL